MPDFPYINARVRAMRSRLLDAGRMEELLAVPTLDAFTQALNTTPYGHEVQEALTRYPALQAVDAALARNFYHTTTKIRGFADGKPRQLIEVVLMRWDLANLRLILRGTHTGSRGEDLAANVIPAGSLNEAALRELAAQPPARGRREKARFFIPGGRIVSADLFVLLADRQTAEQGVKWLRIQGFPVKTVSEDLTAFERDLDLAIIKAQTNLYLGDPLSIDIVVAYLALKYNEVKNLRLIARSKQLGIPRDRVRKEMVVV